MHCSVKGVISLIIGIFIFSSIEVVSKYIETGLPPFRLAMVRFFVGGLVLLPAMLKFGKAKLEFADYLKLAGLGFVGVTLMSSFFHLAILRCPANVAAIVFSCNPAFVAVFAYFMLKEKITVSKFFACVLCLLGVGWIGFNSDSSADLSIVGILLMLCSSVLFAGYTVLLKKVATKYSAVTVASVSSIFGGLFLLPISFFVDGLSPWIYSTDAWLGTAYLAVVGTGLGFLFYFYGITHVQASLGSMTFFLKPFIAALFAWILLGENLSASVLVGGGIILCGIALTFLPQLLKNGKQFIKKEEMK